MREGFARAGDFHPFAILDPPGQPGEFVAQSTDGYRLHGAIMLRHGPGDVKGQADAVAMLLSARPE